MKKLALAAMMILLTGCSVSKTKEINYLPSTATRNSEYFSCYEKSRGYTSNASLSGRYGSASSRISEDEDYIYQCMRHNGYRLRDTTTGEDIYTIITMPIAFPLIFLGVNPQIY